VPKAPRRGTSYSQSKETKEHEAMITTRSVRRAIVSGAGLALGLSFLIGVQVPVSHADNPDQPSLMDGGDSHVERGKIVGWPGGDAVIYPTLGFFGNAHIFAVGAVEPDGSFSIDLPPVVPVDLLGKSTDQCSTIQTSDTEALSNFTGNYLISQHGNPIGATHSASSPGFASFTSFHDGDTRTGLFYADRNVTLTGSCDRMLSFGAVSIDFLQEFDITAHKGWNTVVAVLSVPEPDHIVAHLTQGSNRANERWFFFSTSTPSMSHGTIGPDADV
jgi:hypothetical protein